MSEATMENDELRAFLNTAEGPVPEGGKKKGRGRKKKAEGEAEKKEPKPRRDNIAFIQSLNSIQAVRRARQIAIAKKAKSIERPEAVERYEKEIEAANAKLAELEQIAMNDPNPIKKFVELDEEPNKIITRYIAQKEEEFKKWEEENEFKVSRTALKNAPADIPAEFFDELGEDFAKDLADRFDKNDYRLQAICRKFNFKKEVEAGRIQNVKGRWVKEGEAPPEDE